MISYSICLKIRLPSRFYLFLFILMFSEYFWRGLVLPRSCNALKYWKSLHKTQKHARHYATWLYKFSGRKRRHLLLTLNVSGLFGPSVLFCAHGSLWPRARLWNGRRNCSSCWDQLGIQHTKYHLSVGLWAGVKDKALIRRFHHYGKDHLTCSSSWGALTV